MAETRQFVMLPFWLIHFTCFTHAAASLVTCSGKYVPSDESLTCVKLFTDLRGSYDWYEARDECGRDGGDLVKIVNQAMNDLIYSMAVSDSDFFSQVNPWTWIGLNDPNSDNTWVWLDEKDQAAWTNWQYSQPNGGSDDCVALSGEDNGEWWDTDCYDGNSWTMKSYVCEIPALTIITSLATTSTTMTTRTTSTTETTPEITSTSRNETTPEITTPATSASSGTTFTTTSLSDVTSDSSLGGLSVAVIAGIVTGVVVVAALVPAAILTIRYLRNRQRTGHSLTDHSVAYTNGLDDREAKVTVG